MFNLVEDILFEGIEYKSFKDSSLLKQYGELSGKAEDLAFDKKYKEALSLYKKCKPILEKAKNQALKIKDEKDKNRAVKYIERWINYLDGDIQLVEKKMTKEEKKATKESAMLEEACAKFLEENFSEILAENDFIISITEK